MTNRTAGEQVRIDWRRDPDSEFENGPPEPAATVDRNAIESLNATLGWEKYRIVNVTQEVAREEVE